MDDKCLSNHLTENRPTELSVSIPHDVDVHATVPLLLLSPKAMSSGQVSPQVLKNEIKLKKDKYKKLK